MRKNRTLTEQEYKVRVQGWLEEAKNKKASHLIVAYDLSKKSPFPVYVGRTTNVQQKIKSFNDNDFVRAIEVYDMSKDLNAQLLQARTWNI